MCDRHKGRALDYYCLEHEVTTCSQCAYEDHAQTPCESMPLTKAAKYIVPKLEDQIVEFRKLKEVSQSILDGRREEHIIQTVSKLEKMIDDFAATMKCKLQKAMTSTEHLVELSAEDRAKLTAVVSKPVPAVPILKETINSEEAKDLVALLKEVTKHTEKAEETLDSLPNYVEVAVNKDLHKLLSFNGNPIVIKRKGLKKTKMKEVEGLKMTHSQNQEKVKLTARSSFSLEHCVDIVMLGDYAIASVGDSVQKRDRKRMSFRQAIAVLGAGHLCVLGESTLVAVIQSSGRIGILETFPSLKIVYALMGNHLYKDISYLENVRGAVGCPEQSPVFAVCYSTHRPYKTEYVELVKPKPTKHPYRPPTFCTETKTIADSSYGKHKSLFRDITSVCALHGRNILVGASHGVTCLNKSGMLIWEADFDLPVASIVTLRTQILISIKDDRRIITIGDQGRLVNENILPSMNLYPDRLSVHDNVLMVKHSGQSSWMIFMAELEPQDHD